ncbi:MAG: GTP cyclohydrolase II [Proteobacteria bacterium]|nr:GTP cyclohydrolase II [Pseudomonadota bacterium]
MKFNSIEEILADIRQGKMVVLVDDESRENEGDLVFAAEKTTPEAISFMLNEGKGLICISLTKERLKKLNIPLQVSENTSHFGTNFAVSFDHKTVSNTGVTAQARTTTILNAIAQDAVADDFVLPGFVFPVCAVEGGVLKRRGQTEGSVDLARLAGLNPSGVICEIMGEDGKMVRGKALFDYCKKYSLKICSVEQLVQYRLHNEVFVRRVGEMSIDSLSEFARNQKLVEILKKGQQKEIKIRLYYDDVEELEHFALIVGNVESSDKTVLSRIHSECLTGDVFGSKRCDCGEQLDKSLAMIFEKGEGVLVYLLQEGRGIGLGNKLKAYHLQDSGEDTVDANLKLGFEVDSRSYRVAAQILADLGIKKVDLITNNPEKLAALDEFDIEVENRIPLAATVDEFNLKYLKTKKEKLGHLIDL